jgi:hypothetical protein
MINSMNEALPNTEFRQVQPSDGYEIDWATNGGTVQGMRLEFHKK